MTGNFATFPLNVPWTLIHFYAMPLQLSIPNLNWSPNTVSLLSFCQLYYFVHQISFKGCISTVRLGNVLPV